MRAVLALDAGPGEIGLLATVQTLPFLFFAIPMGLIADRTLRRRLMVFCEILPAISLLGLILLTFTPWLSVGTLAALGFVGAVGTVGFSVGAPALLPALVPSSELARANGRLELARSAACALDRRGVEYLLVRSAGGLRAVRGASARVIRRNGRDIVGGLRRWHGGWSAACVVGRCCHALWTGHCIGTGGVGDCRRDHGADAAGTVGCAGRIVVFFCLALARSSGPLRRPLCGKR